MPNTCAFAEFNLGEGDNLTIKHAGQSKLGFRPDQ